MNRLCIIVWRRGCRDFILTVCLFILAVTTSLCHFEAHRTDRSVVSAIDTLYGPAIMYALGYGYYSPAIDATPELQSFLQGKTNALDRSMLPDVIPEEPSAVAAYHRYLLFTVGLYWRLFGVSWSSLEYLLSFMMGWCAVVIYGLMRLGMGRILSFFSAAAVIVSPAMLGTLYEFRDFSKTPFILSIIFIIGCMIKFHILPRCLHICSLAMGILAGVGMGFRQDLLIFMPLGLIVTVIAVIRLNYRYRRCHILIPMLFILGFYSMAWPMFGRMEAGAQPYHPLVQGFSVKHLDSLSIESPAYELVASGEDMYVFPLICNYYQRLNRLPKASFPFNAPEHQFTARQWVIDMGMHFPADMAARGFAAVARILRYGDAFPPWRSTPSRRHRSLYDAHEMLSLHLHRFGLVYALVALAILLWKRPVMTLGLYFFVLYVLGYTALQCEYRHTFHLAFTPFWIMGFLLQQAINAVQRLRSGMACSPNVLRTVGVRFVLTAACIVLITFVPLHVLRAFQQQQAQALFAPYVEADLSPLSASQQSQFGWTLYALDPKTRDNRDLQALYQILTSLLKGELRLWHTRTRYLVAEFDGATPMSWIILTYQSAIARNDYTQLMRLPRAVQENGLQRYYFPVHETLMAEHDPVSIFARNRFVGIAVPDSAASSFRGLYEVHLPEACVFLPHLAFSPKDIRIQDKKITKDCILYQRIDWSTDPLRYCRAENSAHDVLNMATVCQRYNRDAEYHFYLKAALFMARDTETHLYASHALWEEGCMDAALEGMRSLQPETEELTQRAVDLLAKIGQRYLTMNALEKAEAAFAEAWRLHPDKEAEYRFVLTLASEKLCPEAVTREQYRTLLLAFPEYGAGAAQAHHWLLGNVTEEQREKTWREISERHPHSAFPHLYLGIALESRGNAVAAADAYAAAYANAPENAEIALRYATSSPEALNPDTISNIITESLEREPGLRSLAGICLQQAAERAVQRGKAELGQTLWALAASYTADADGLLLEQAAALITAGNIAGARPILEKALDASHGERAAAMLDALLTAQGTMEARHACWSRLLEQHPEHALIKRYRNESAGTAAKEAIRTGNFQQAKELFDILPAELKNTPDMMALQAIIEYVWESNSPVFTLDDSLSALDDDPKSVMEESVLKALQYLREAGDSNRIAALAQVGVKHYPHSEAMWIARIEYPESGSDDAAQRQHFREALVNVKDTRRIASIINARFEQQNDLRNRVDFWSSLAAIKPDDSEILGHLGTAHAATGDWTAAAVAYAAALESHPQSDALRIRLGAVLMAQGHTDTGKTMLHEALSVSPDLTPSAGWICQQAGNVCMAQNRLEQAEILYEWAVQWDDKDPFSWLQLGKTRQLLNQMPKAVDAWRHAVSVHPNAAASRQAAELLDQSLDIHARLTLWQEISSQQPDALLPVLRQTMALLEAGNKNEAQRLCNLLAERYPHDGETMIMNGILSCLCDHKAHPVRLDQIPPDALDAQSAAMAERLSSAAHIARESGQWECALLFLQKACRLDADNLSHPVALGETFFSLRRFEEAAEPFSRVLLAAPESPHSAKLLDEALQQLNDPEKRLQYWRRILEAHPDARIPRQYYEALLN